MTDRKFNIYNQPRYIYDLSIVEAGERFTYYGVQILLVFFIIDKLNFSHAKSVELVGSFIALLGVNSVLGGFIADKILGSKRALVLGIYLLMLGYISLALLAFPGVVSWLNDFELLCVFYWALGVIFLGNACFKTIAASMLVKVYSPSDQRYDIGYTLFYQSINIGALIGFLLTPIVQQKWGYTPAFLLCVVGLGVSLLWFYFNLRKAEFFNTATDSLQLSPQRWGILLLSIVFFPIMAAYLLAHLSYISTLILLMTAIVLVVLFYLIIKEPWQVSKKIIALLFLSILYILFLSLELQMFGSLNLFIETHVMREVGKWTIPPGNFAMLNPIFGIALSLVLAKSYMYLERKKWQISIPVRISIGLLFTASSFLFLSFSASTATEGVISYWWIVITYFLISLGETLVRVLGLAFVCKLAPPQFTNVFVGIFFLAAAIGGWLSGVFGHWTDLSVDLTDKQMHLENSLSLFNNLGKAVFGLGFIALLLAPMLNRLAQDE